MTEDDSAWHLRSSRSNTETSIPSPPAEDLPDYDDYSSLGSGSYAMDLLCRHFAFPDPTQKASPTSSTEADADIDTDIDQDGWDGMPHLDAIGSLPSPDAPHSETGRQYDWNGANRTLEPR